MTSTRFPTRDRPSPPVSGGGTNGTKGERPEQVIRIGTLKAAIWLNASGEGGGGKAHRSVSLSRSFQQDGQWREQRINLLPSEVPAIGEILKEVMRRLFAAQNQDGEEIPI